MRAEPLQPKPKPKPSRHLVVRLLDDEHSTLQAAAKAERTTVSALVRGILREHVPGLASIERQAS